MPNAPRKIALTGISGYAMSYLNTLGQVSADLAALKALTAINRSEHEARCQKMESEGVEVFTDFSHMIQTWQNRVDLCILPVPIHLHLPMTLQALSAGMNVLLEKPMAGSVAQAQAICDADSADKRIAIGFQDMYRPSTHAIANELNGGRIGKITGVKMLVLWPRSKSYYTRNNWAGAIEVDGQVVRDSPINNATAHFVNLALFFAGLSTGKMAKAETVSAELFRAREIPSFDTAAIRVLTNTGIPLHLYASHSCKDNENAKVIVEGEKGSLTWLQGQDVEWKVEGEIEKVEIEDTDDTNHIMFASVLQSLAEGTPFKCTPKMAMAHVELVENLHLYQEIKNFRPEVLVHENPKGDHKIYLPSMADDLKRCLRENALPSEIGLDWV